jgi:hypothetical protein
LVYEDFRKSVENVQVSLKSDKKNGNLLEDQQTVLSYLAHLFSEREMFQAKIVAKIKTHILCSVPFFRKSCRFLDNVVKYCRAGQATDENMAHALCMLGT